MAAARCRLSASDWRCVGTLVTTPKCVRNSVEAPHRSNRLQALEPPFHVDVGWRRRRQHVAAVHAHAGGVAHERHAARLVEVADVVRGVAGRVGDVPRAAARRHRLAAAADHQVALRHRRHFTPQAVHRVAVQPRRAVEQLRGVHQVRRAALVHHDLDPGVTAQDRPRRPGVVEVNVREQEMRDRGERLAVQGQRRLERVETGGSAPDRRWPHRPSR